MLLNKPNLIGCYILLSSFLWRRKKRKKKWTQQHSAVRQLFSSTSIFIRLAVSMSFWFASFSGLHGLSPLPLATGHIKRAQTNVIRFGKLKCTSSFLPRYRPVAPREAAKHQRRESDREHWRQGKRAASLGPPQRGRPAAPPLQSDLERPEWKGKQQGRRRGKASPVQLISHLPQKPSAALTLASNTEHIFLSHLHC